MVQGPTWELGFLFFIGADDELLVLSDTGTMMKWHMAQKNYTLLVEDRDLVRPLASAYALHSFAHHRL